MSETSDQPTYALSQLKVLRHERGLTQAELSRVSGVPLSTIQKHERGAYPDVTLSVAVPLARALGVSVEELSALTLSSEMLKMRDAEGVAVRVPA